MARRPDDWAARVLLGIFSPHVISPDRFRASPSRVPSFLSMHLLERTASGIAELRTASPVRGKHARTMEPGHARRRPYAAVTAGTLAREAA
jgi:hypothetical protein